MIKFLSSFSTAGYRRKYPRKTKDIYNFSRSLGKDIEIDKAGHGHVVVTVPFNFQIPIFLANSEFGVKALQDASNSMMDERMSVMEKKMKLLQCIWDEVNVNPAKFYSAVTRGNDDYSGTVLRRNKMLYFILTMVRQFYNLSRVNYISTRVFI